MLDGVGLRVVWTCAAACRQDACGARADVEWAGAAATAAAEAAVSANSMVFLRRREERDAL